jgi:uncharacterized protein (DUF3084 family)
MSILDHYQAIIEKYEKSLSEKDEKISNLEKTISEKDEKISNLEKTISEKDEKISNLEKKISEKDILLIEKIENIAKLYQEIIDLKSKILLIIFFL